MKKSNNQTLHESLIEKLVTKSMITQLFRLNSHLWEPKTTWNIIHISNSVLFPSFSARAPSWNKPVIKQQSGSNPKFNTIKKKIHSTLETILNLKLETYPGSNLFRTALAAASWTEEDGRFESKRLSKAFMASGSDKAIGKSVAVRIKIRNLELKLDMVDVVGSSGD
jgi:hypothetical protein